MPEEDKVFKGKIKRGGIFNFKDFYSFMYDWLITEGFELNEKEYYERVTGDAKQVEIFWSCDRVISDYFLFQITAKWIILGMKDIEVQKEGKKVKMQQGLVEVNFTGSIIKDPNSEWEEKRAFFRWLRKMYDKYIIRSRIDRYEIELLSDMDDLISQSKAFLAMEGQH